MSPEEHHHPVRSGVVGMGKVKLHNPTKTPTVVWYGPTQYRVAAGESLIVEAEVARTAVAHEDYAHLEVHNLNDEVIHDSQEPVPDPEPDPGPQVWDDEEWNPIECDFSEIEAYVTHHELSIADGLTEGKIREIVDQHLMEQV